jgi:sulfate adenylyltransferase subunit 2
VTKYALHHLALLENEAIRILREVANEFRRPVLLYSAGKDSSVLLHLCRKAFHPGRLPFPLLHVNTAFKFRAMLTFRDEAAKDAGAQMIEWINETALREGVDPFGDDSERYTRRMKTEALRQALDHHGFDAAIGGARRDEERSRAKERVFSFRDRQHVWEPRRQRPEPWNLFDTRIAPGESVRVFPLSDWTELDIWVYLHLEQIPVVPLYFAAPRPVVWRNGTWILVDDDRLQLRAGETVQQRIVRFRTLGCYPLTGGIESPAATPLQVIAELLESRHSERQGRLIDREHASSMEQKKREGYF